MYNQKKQRQKTGLRIAVVGGGAAGMAASYYLGQKHEVDLFEVSPKLGGHVQTVMADDGDNRKIPVDMGFIVFNNRTYPKFCRFLDDLGVKSAPTDMSFSYSEPQTGFAYAGTGLSGLFAHRINIINPGFWKMILAVLKFCRHISRDLEQGRLKDGTLGGYIRANNYPGILMDRYLEPMVRAIWSAEEHEPENFPLERFARFFSNHGLLSIRGGPTWLYIPGGSHTYVKAFEQRFSGTIRTGCPVKGVSRSKDAVTIHLEDQVLKYDAVVLACHADMALELLRDPGNEEIRLLIPWQYVGNEVVMHTDPSFLPPNPRAWACWNVIAQSGDKEKRVHVHYWMNLLQRFSASKNHVVTLNPRRTVPGKAVSRRLEMFHPVFNASSLSAQADLASLQGVRNTFFCGSYHGNGFHEDAAASGVRVAELLGAGQ
ncbi:NAD(P)/FAD-dependent oxidoreductase [Desulfonatronovibrio hydrogenovorans]|uniref:NAD(P)/FAD-dependent oxidoreductase n=1 Tax=Desulfonatronovibrio hydrogenovorans TaxID=53245 RepID=UPI0006907C87|nr:FAD-dependent oxidoreductase [Desulfonatronovibrio hydrogenovorans]